MDFNISKIRNDFLIKVREAGLDDQNQPVVTSIAEGGEPCRDVLRRAIKGEKLILASYCPFSTPGPYKEYGPIFVLAEHSDELINYDQVPFSLIKETNYFSDIFVLKAYDDEQSIFDAKLVHPEDADKVIANFFVHKEVDFIIARYAAYGCYALRIERG